MAAADLVVKLVPSHLLVSASPFRDILQTLDLTTLLDQDDHPDSVSLGSSDLSPEPAPVRAEEIAT